MLASTGRSRRFGNNVFRSDPVTNSDETGTFFYLSLLGSLSREHVPVDQRRPVMDTELQPDGDAGVR